MVFLIFNRPDTTKQVFETICKARPKQLFIAADGPRLNKLGEKEKVQVVRDIASNVDWDCDVKTLFRDKNLGCRIAVSSAIDWFFENVEEGIILEDDCLPSQSFFCFCEELLERYKNDMRIMLISGHNKQKEWKAEQFDYFFSNLGGIWGWASWKRAWEKNDINMTKLEDFIAHDYFKYIFGNKLGHKRAADIQMANKENVNTWDYQWGFSRHINSGLACVPSKNLITNIGLSMDATHTTGEQKAVENFEISFPLEKNEFIVPDREYDALFLSERNLFDKLKEKINWKK